MEHVELVLSNSIKFNGADSAFTQTASKVVDVCRATLEDYDEHLTQLENDIAAAKKAAEAEAADLIDVAFTTPGVSLLANGLTAYNLSNDFYFLSKLQTVTLFDFYFILFLLL